MLKGIIAITGKPGLYRLLSRGKNALIVEDLRTGKRQPAYNHEKVISLADISIYTENGDVPLPEVLEKVSAYTGGQPVDLKAFATDADLRSYFAEILPDYDKERVYTTDIRKLLSWYNQLIAAGVTEFKENEIAEDEAAEAAEKADETNSAE